MNNHDMKLSIPMHKSNNDLLHDTLQFNFQSYYRRTFHQSNENENDIQLFTFQKANPLLQGPAVSQNIVVHPYISGLVVGSGPFCICVDTVAKLPNNNSSNSTNLKFSPHVITSFYIDGNADWCVGIIPESHSAYDTYVWEKSNIGLISSFAHKINSFLRNCNIHRKRIDVYTNAFTRQITFEVDGIIIESSLLSVDSFPCRIAICGNIGTKVLFIDELVPELSYDVIESHKLITIPRLDVADNKYIEDLFKICYETFWSNSTIKRFNKSNSFYLSIAENFHYHNSIKDINTNAIPSTLSLCESYIYLETKDELMCAAVITSTFIAISSIHHSLWKAKAELKAISYLSQYLLADLENSNYKIQSISSIDLNLGFPCVQNWNLKASDSSLVIKGAVVVRLYTSKGHHSAIASIDHIDSEFSIMIMQLGDSEILSINIGSNSFQSLKFWGIEYIIGEDCSRIISDGNIIKRFRPLEILDLITIQCSLGLGLARLFINSELIVEFKLHVSDYSIEDIHYSYFVKLPLHGSVSLIQSGINHSTFIKVNPNIQKFKVNAPIGKSLQYFLDLSHQKMLLVDNESKEISLLDSMNHYLSFQCLLALCRQSLFELLIVVSKLMSGYSLLPLVSIKIIKILESIPRECNFNRIGKFKRNFAGTVVSINKYRRQSVVQQSKSENGNVIVESIVSVLWKICIPNHFDGIYEEEVIPFILQQLDTYIGSMTSEGSLRTRYISSLICTLSRVLENRLLLLDDYQLSEILRHSIVSTISRIIQSSENDIDIIESCLHLLTYHKSLLFIEKELVSFIEENLNDALKWSSKLIVFELLFSLDSNCFMTSISNIDCVYSSKVVLFLQCACETIYLAVTQMNSINMEIALSIYFEYFCSRGSSLLHGAILDLFTYHRLHITSINANDVFELTSSVVRTYVSSFIMKVFKHYVTLFESLKTSNRNVYLSDIVHNTYFSGSLIMILYAFNGLLNQFPNTVSVDVLIELFDHLKLAIDSIMSISKLDSIVVSSIEDCITAITSLQFSIISSISNHSINIMLKKIEQVPLKYRNFFIVKLATLLSSKQLEGNDVSLMHDFIMGLLRQFKKNSSSYLIQCMSASTISLLCIQFKFHQSSNVNHQNAITDFIEVCLQSKDDEVFSILLVLLKSFDVKTRDVIIGKKPMVQRIQQVLSNFVLSESKLCRFQSPGKLLSENSFNGVSCINLCKSIMQCNDADGIVYAPMNDYIPISHMFSTWMFIPMKSKGGILLSKTSLVSTNDGDLIDSFPNLEVYLNEEMKIVLAIGSHFVAMTSQSLPLQSWVHFSYSIDTTKGIELFINSMFDSHYSFPLEVFQSLTKIEKKSIYSNFLNMDTPMLISESNCYNYVLSFNNIDVLDFEKIQIVINTNGRKESLDLSMYSKKFKATGENPIIDICTNEFEVKYVSGSLTSESTSDSKPKKILTKTKSSFFQIREVQSHIFLSIDAYVVTDVSKSSESWSLSRSPFVLGKNPFQTLGKSIHVFDGMVSSSLLLKSILPIGEVLHLMKETCPLINFDTSSNLQGFNLDLLTNAMDVLGDSIVTSHLIDKSILFPEFAECIIRFANPIISKTLNSKACKLLVSIYSINNAVPMISKLLDDFSLKKANTFISPSLLKLGMLLSPQEIIQTSSNSFMTGLRSQDITIIVQILLFYFEYKPQESIIELKAILNEAIQIDFSNSNSIPQHILMSLMGFVYFLSEANQQSIPHVFDIMIEHMQFLIKLLTLSTFDSRKLLNTTKVSLEFRESFESDHPYITDKSLYWKVSYPGVVGLVIDFDRRSAISKYDYISIYEDETKERFYGKQRYSGVYGDDIWFEKVEIPLDHCFIEFHCVGGFRSSSDSHDNSLQHRNELWGVKFTVHVIGKIQYIGSERHIDLNLHHLRMLKLYTHVTLKRLLLDMNPSSIQSFHFIHKKELIEMGLDEILKLLLWNGSNNTEMNIELEDDSIISEDTDALNELSLYLKESSIVSLSQKNPFMQMGSMASLESSDFRIANLKTISTNFNFIMDLQFLLRDQTNSKLPNELLTDPISNFYEGGITLSKLSEFIEDTMIDLEHVFNDAETLQFPNMKPLMKRESPKFPAIVNPSLTLCKKKLIHSSNYLDLLSEELELQLVLNIYELICDIFNSKLFSLESTKQLSFPSIHAIVKVAMTLSKSKMIANESLLLKSIETYFEHILCEVEVESVQFALGAFNHMFNYNVSGLLEKLANTNAIDDNNNYMDNVHDIEDGHEYISLIEQFEKPDYDVCLTILRLMFSSTVVSDERKLLVFQLWHSNHDFQDLTISALQITFLHLKHLNSHFLLESLKIFQQLCVLSMQFCFNSPNAIMEESIVHLLEDLSVISCQIETFFRLSRNKKTEIWKLMIGSKSIISIIEFIRFCDDLKIHRKVPSQSNSLCILNKELFIDSTTNVTWLRLHTNIKLDGLVDSVDTSDCMKEQNIVIEIIDMKPVERMSIHLSFGSDHQDVITWSNDGEILIKDMNYSQVYVTASFKRGDILNLKAIFDDSTNCRFIYLSKNKVIVGCLCLSILIDSYQDNDIPFKVETISCPEAIAFSIQINNGSLMSNSHYNFQLLSSIEGEEHYGLDRYYGSFKEAEYNDIFPLIIPSSEFVVKFISDEDNDYKFYNIVATPLFSDYDDTKQLNDITLSSIKASDHSILCIGQNVIIKELENIEQGDIDHQMVHSYGRLGIITSINEHFVDLKIASGETITCPLNLIIPSSNGKSRKDNCKYLIPPSCRLHHEMDYVFEIPKSYREADCIPCRVGCDNCKKLNIDVEGLFYHCKICSFDICYDCAEQFIDRVYETEHPYPDNLEQVEVIQITGSEGYKIVFDLMSIMESGYDYVAFYKDENRQSFWGEPRYFGGQFNTARNFPGVDGNPPLIIESPSFVYYFHSDGSNSSWGIRFVVTPIHDIKEFKSMNSLPNDKYVDSLDSVDNFNKNSEVPNYFRIAMNPIHECNYDNPIEVVIYSSDIDISLKLDKQT